MNLIFGERRSNPVDKLLLGKIGQHINDTLARELLEPETVIRACEAVLKSLKLAERMKQLEDAGVQTNEIHHSLKQMQMQLDREHLLKRLQRELPEQVEVMPLGTLFHITAGNTYGLPAFSVLEGLLTGNINLIKLPGTGDEVSILILEWLIEAEPILADYIYVFGFSSWDRELMIELSKLADAVVVWGGDEAVKTVRTLADPNIRLIEWGHKIGFAYVDPDAVTVEQLEEVAKHMCRTSQLYCNSCQGIYLDTADDRRVNVFSEKFSEILEAEYQKEIAKELPIGLKAQMTLKLRSREIEAIQYPHKGHLYRNRNTSVWADKNKQLETSYLFGNCWVKPLPKEELIRTLKPLKSYLQTAVLYCQESNRNEYERLLFRAGVSRITTAKHLDQIDFSIPHDGEYALRKYCRIITCE